MKLNWFIATLLLGLAVCGLLIVRHHRRTPAAQDGLKPLDAWQKTIRCEPAHELRSDDNWRDRLRREEQRQRPQEGRN